MKSFKEFQTEQVEALDELSKRTLSGYVSKAGRDLVMKSTDKASAASRSSIARMADKPEEAESHSAERSDIHDKMIKRASGISTAARKLAKEEVELDEVIHEGVTDVTLAKRKPISQRSEREQAAINAAKRSKARKGTVEVHLKHEDGSITKNKFKLTKDQSKWDDEAKEIASGHLKNMQHIHDRFPDISGSKAKDVHKVVIKESVELDEVLNPSMGAGEYVKDFEKSDAPQFKGKSKEKRRIMGIAAYMAAKRENK